MRMIYAVPLVFVVLGAATTARAQGEQPAMMVGMPEYGVALSGSPENPVIENHSGRVVIGYVLTTADQNGRGAVHQRLLATSVQPSGIPDGGSLYARGAMPVNPTVPMQSPAHLFPPGQGPIVRATLQNVVFTDGRFLGVDEYGAFEGLVKQIKAVTEVGTLARAGAWDQVEAFAHLPLLPPPGEEDLLAYTLHQLSASRLVETRKFKGNAAAAQLAELYSELPTLWK